MSENSKRPVTVRFDKEVHERLQQMSQDSGDSITELVRNLVERALEKNTQPSCSCRRRHSHDALRRSSKCSVMPCRHCTSVWLASSS